MNVKCQAALKERLGVAQHIPIEDFQPLRRLLTLQLEGRTFKPDSAVLRHCFVVQHITQGWMVNYLH